MTKSFHIVVFLIVLVFCGCNSSSESGNKEDIYKGIPSSAYAVAENDSFIVFLNDEAIEDSIEGLPSIKQVSLWVYDKNRKEGKKILFSHPNTKMAFLNMEHSVSIPLDSIPTITKVTILSWPNEPMKLLAEGCSDYRNVESFIINEDSDNAICLPTNRGLIGISEEDGLLIMQSYDYYEDGGRYNIIEAFDVKGIRVSSMNVKTKN
ncbi:MAG: hypothetical protein MSA35_05020 [Prevotella sp.]|nr:hypothetical protein [Prevotella sp.]